MWEFDFRESESCIFHRHEFILTRVCVVALSLSTTIVSQNIMHYFVVKFLREITPYFKKTTSLSDIGWDDSGTSHISTSPSSSTTVSSSVAGSATSSAWSDRKTIPLTNCYVCQNLSMIDKDLCTIEMHAPDGQSSCFLKCPDRVSASAWFNSITMNVVNRMHCVGLLEANRIMSQISTGRVINHMGWLAQQVGPISVSALKIFHP